MILWIYVGKVLFLGSTCIYPKNAIQPMSENSLSGPMEQTNHGTQ